MKKFLMVLGFAGLTATLSACQTTDNRSGLSSLDHECRSAGYCDGTEQVQRTVVKSSTSRVNRTERVFSDSLRK